MKNIPRGKKLSELNSVSDIVLMQRVANYDSKALEHLYNRYSPLIYSLLVKILKDEKLAEEAIVEVFAIIWRKIEKFDLDSGNVYAWLILLTRNKAIDILRRKRENNLPEYTEEFEDQFIIPYLSKETDPLDMNTAQTLRDGIENALERMTDAQQFVISLAFFEGFTEKQIAEKLNIPNQTVKSKIKISLSNLRENLVRGDD